MLGTNGMSTVQRIIRHGRLSWKNLGIPRVPTPPFLILFINSICNLTCEHCFYWRNLNRRDDLTYDEIAALSQELGRIENLNLSGGEPFLRADFAEICRLFIQNNGVEQIYVPTNGYFTDRTVDALKSVFEEKKLKLFVCELSIDGMPEYHNRFRGNPKSFQKLIETYEALAKLQSTEPRLRIHAISTVTSENLNEVKKLTTYLYDRFPKMEHHNLALIRGDRKNPALLLPNLTAYDELVQYARRLWAPREEKRYGSLVEPMLHWAKAKTAKQQTQVVPCRAGVLSAVVYANGDVVSAKPTRHSETCARGPSRRSGTRPKRKLFAEALVIKSAGARTKSLCGRASITNRYSLRRRSLVPAPGSKRNRCRTQRSSPYLKIPRSNSARRSRFSRTLLKRFRRIHSWAR